MSGIIEWHRREMESEEAPFDNMMRVSWMVPFTGEFDREKIEKAMDPFFHGTTHEFNGYVWKYHSNSSYLIENELFLLVYYAKTS